MRILILGAFTRELDGILKQFTNLTETIIAKRRCMRTKWDNHDLVISCSGVGTIASASTTTALCERFEPDLIIICGVAGGLDSEQKVGDLVLANKIIDADLFHLSSMLSGTPYETCLTDPHTSKPITNEYIVQPLILDTGASVPVDRLKIGTIVTSNLFPAPKSLFAEIKNLGCSAIEMESVGVFKAAEYYDIPVMTIRAISNLLNDSGIDLGTDSDALAICSERLAQFLTLFLRRSSELEKEARLNQKKKVDELIKKYDLIKHPEGGWYRQTFLSEDLVKAEGNSAVRYFGEPRAAGTSIIYLLSQGDYSAWHTVQSDETWSFHAGDPLLLRVVDPDNGNIKEALLGGTGGLLQFTVKAGHIFSAESLGRYSLTGCMVTPGFDFKDFKLITRTEFLTGYPQHAILARLARDSAVESGIKNELKTNGFDSKFFDPKKFRVSVNNEVNQTHLIYPNVFLNNDFQ